MNKSVFIGTAALAASVAFAQGTVATADVAKIVLAAKEGDAIKHKWELTLQVAGIEAVAKATLNSKVEKAENGQISQGTEFQDFSVLLDGTDPGIPVAKQEIVVKADGTLVSAKGGIEGGDPVRTYLLMHFVPPTKELAVNEEYEHKFAEQKDAGIPAFTFKGKYVGKETVLDIAGFKFETTMKEDLEGGVEATNVFVVAADGRILKLDSKFVRLPVPVAGQSVDGKITSQIVN